MSLFQNSVLKKYLQRLDQKKVDQAWEVFSSHFHNKEIQENIRAAKEEQYQGEFLIDLFVKVFGYIKNPSPSFNLTTELKNVKGAKKTDGAILKGDTALAVIELKGTKVTDLDKVESQAFGYKNNQPGCNYVITSNFEKLRFYIDNAVDHEPFNLFSLTRERFNVLWLCLSSESLLKDLPKQIKDESLTEEEDITKKLYKDYSLFRNEIFASIQKNNPEYDKLTLFKKTQKLLDRFLFIFFAEDKQLLPPNSINSIVSQWTELRDKYDEYQPLYSRFQKYFGYLNIGHKGQKHEIFAYNGGLFEPDQILDNIKIDDEVLYKHTVNLSNYDFESEVSVNILGHIFEHSLNDIEEIQAELKGEVVDKKKSKRKKDGVFYTPKYITKYIVENTLGKLCEEKKTEYGIERLDINDEFYTIRESKLKGTGGQVRKSYKLNKKGKEIYKKSQEYREWLYKVTICDPACGSGAFLNEAFNFLIDEHESIDTFQSNLLRESFTLTEVTKDILENNLYGVDINEESVDIAKLSLWLRTAQKGRKLASLNKNIKCGNSLIDDSSIAGDKAFNWKKEFKDVFLQGGFDIVIGNPPYGAFLSKDEKEFYKKNYKVCEFNFDTYNFFFEKSIEILKTNNFLGLITPNTFLVVENGRKLREFLFAENTLIELYEVFNVFPDAVVEPINIIIKKRDPKNNNTFRVLLQKRNKNHITINSFAYHTIFERQNRIFNYRINPIEKTLLSKITTNAELVGNLVDIKAGVKPYERGKGKPAQTKEIVINKPYNKYKSEGNHWRKVVRGTQVKRYLNKWDGEFIKYGPWLAAPRKSQLFENDKLFMRRTDDNLMASFDETGMIGINSVHCIQIKNEYKEIHLKFLLAILNSTLINWIFRLENFHMVNKPLAEVKVVYVERLPIILSINQNDYVKLVDQMISLNNLLYQKSTNFIQRVMQTFHLIKVNKKLSLFYKYDFKVFISELKKKKVKISLSDQDEWEEYFDGHKRGISELQVQIRTIDKELDQMVYELYGLTNEEIKIVEDIT